MKKVFKFCKNHLNFVILSLLLLVFFQLVGLGQSNAADSQLNAEIGPNRSYVILENSQIYVKYAPYYANHNEFAIKEFRIKSAGNENQVGVGKYNFFDADSGRGALTNASIVYNGTDRKTVRLTWVNEFNDPTKKITQEVTIFGNSRYLKINYSDVQYGINVVDLGEPGGTTAGTHVAYGHSGWIRDYITHKESSSFGSYYNRYPKDGVNDPANGGSLNYNGNFIVGVYNPANGRGLGRVMPVADISIVKLLLDRSTRRGLELFPHPFLKAHQPFTGYLYVVTGGASEILSVGKQLTDGSSVPSPPPPPGTEYNLNASVVGGYGTVSPTSGNYAEGTRVALTARPNTGYCVLEWNGTNNDSSTSTSNAVTMNTNKNVTVQFTSNCGVTSYDLRKSSSPDRTGAVSLNGKTVSGNIYVYTSPDAGVDSVSFYLDGNLHQVENAAPYDLEGTSSQNGFANPLDTTQLNDGNHEIRAVMNLTGGGIEEVFATFTVANDGAGTGAYNLLTSSSIGKTSAMPLGGATVSGDIYVFVTPDAGVDRVNFYLDGIFNSVEYIPPYDFEGTADNGLPIPFDTTQLNDGQHDIRAVIDLTNGSIVEVFKTFTVSNNSAGTGTHYLKMSTSSNRSSAVNLGGRTVSDNIYVFITPNDGIDRVAYYLDGSSYSVEYFAPYDFDGTAGNGLAYPFDTTALNNGQHQIRAVVVLADGSTEEVTAGFTVNN